MSGPGEPLASATLAQLYVSQGHATRALRVVEAVLEDDPFNGHALALGERLRSHTSGSLELSRSDREIAARFRVSPDLAEPLHVVLVTWTTSSPAAEMSSLVSSKPCARTSGELRFESARHGSAAACLVRLDAEGRLRVLAVATPLHW